MANGKSARVGQSRLLFRNSSSYSFINAKDLFDVETFLKKIFVKGGERTMNAFGFAFRSSLWRLRRHEQTRNDYGTFTVGSTILGL